MIAACLFTLPCAPWVLDLPGLAASSTTVRLGIVYLAVLTSVISYLLWYFALSRMAASKVPGEGAAVSGMPLEVAILA